MFRRRREEQKKALMLLLSLRAWYGLDLWRVMRISSGRLYSLLLELEREGYATSWWEDGPEPRRRLYRAWEEPS
jgi:DNA-binding PadR family transcriptional regulator